MMKRLLLVIVWMALAVPAWANHPPTSDSGEDITNIGEAMNQESFWESWFAGPGYTVECTKFEGHNGTIPASYEAAVVKSGSDWVRVYWDPPAQVIGPPNPNDAHPNRRHEAPFSWVMKCDFTEDAPLPPTVSSTCDSVTIDAAEGVEWAIQIGDGFVEGEGTETFNFGKPGQPWAVFYNDQVIAEGVFEACTPEDTTTTSTTVPASTTTSTTPGIVPTTTTTLPASTTTVPITPTTTAPTTSTSLTVLPFTGSEDVPLAVAGLALLGLGAALLRGRKCDTEEGAE